MSTKPDISELIPHRRNLVLVSVLIVLFNLGRGTIDTLSIFGTGLSLERGEILIYFAHLALIYFLWRYWLYANEHHRQIKEGYIREWHKSNLYKALIDSEVRKFEGEIDGPAAPQDEGGNQTSVSNPSPPWDPMRKDVVIRWGRPQLHMRINNTRGDFYPDTKQVELPAFKFYTGQVQILIRSLLREKWFSELLFPYVIAFIAVATVLWAFVANG